MAEGSGGMKISPPHIRGNPERSVATFIQINTMMNSPEVSLLLFPTTPKQEMNQRKVVSC